MKKTIVLGITGSLACGKTTVARMFKELGASCLDADRIYHRLIKPKSSVHKKIIAAFGGRILGKKGQIDRKKLARLVFGKKKGLQKLVRITHPAIIRTIESRLAKLKKSKKRRIIVIDAPLLLEAGLIGIVDKLAVVKVSKKKQIARWVKSRPGSRDEITKRISIQLSLAEKIKLADFVIDNNGTLEQTRKQIKEIWKRISELGG